MIRNKPFTLTFSFAVALALLFVSAQPVFAENGLQQPDDMNPMDPDWFYNITLTVAPEDINHAVHDYIPKDQFNWWMNYSARAETPQIRVGNVEFTDAGKLNVTWYLLGNAFERAGNVSYFNSTGVMTVDFLKDGEWIGGFEITSLEFVNKTYSKEIDTAETMPDCMIISDCCNRPIITQKIVSGDNYDIEGTFEISKAIRPTESSVAVVMKGEESTYERKPFLLFARIYEGTGDNRTFFTNSYLFEVTFTEKGCAVSPAISIISFKEKGTVEIVNAITGEVIAANEF